jgi:hypothetical protein
MIDARAAAHHVAKFVSRLAWPEKACPFIGLLVEISLRVQCNLQIGVAAVAYTEHTCAIRG